MTTNTPATSTLHAAIRQTAGSLAYGAAPAAAVAVGGAAAYAAHRLLPNTWTSGTRTLTAGSTGLAVALLVDNLADDLLAPLRTRFAPTTPARDLRPMAPLQTLEDALAHVTVDTETDAARRAAKAYQLDEGDGLLRDRRRWRGYPDGTASCHLAPGVVLHFARYEGRFGPRDEYTLLTSTADQPVRVTNLAQLRLHLDARTAGLSVASAPGEDRSDGQEPPAA